MTVWDVVFYVVVAVVTLIVLRFCVQVIALFLLAAMHRRERKRQDDLSAKRFDIKKNNRWTT